MNLPPGERAATWTGSSGVFAVRRSGFNSLTAGSCRVEYRASHARACAAVGWSAKSCTIRSYTVRACWPNFS